MSFDLSIKKMLENYSDAMPQSDKLREILQQTALLGLEPFYITTFRTVDLCAGKMHAVLCRAWRNRVKGRDWYDLIWYIQNKIPVNLTYLQKKMVQTGHLAVGDSFGEPEFRERLRQRIDSVDWELAKADVAPFIQDKRRLDLWSSQFFHDLVQQLKIAN